MNGWVILILLAFATPVIIYFFRYTFSRMKNYGNVPDPTATIVGVRSENDNWGKYKHIKTIISFSDGTEYHTYKCRKEPGFGYTRIIVDAEVIEEIKENAIKAHKKLIEKNNR